MSNKCCEATKFGRGKNWQPNATPSDQNQHLSLLSGSQQSHCGQTSIDRTSNSQHTRRRKRNCAKHVPDLQAGEREEMPHLAAAASSSAPERRQIAGIKRRIRRRRPQIRTRNQSRLLVYLRRRGQQCPPMASCLSARQGEVVRLQSPGVNARSDKDTGRPPPPPPPLFLHAAHQSPMAGCDSQE
jgi:hypothetical protein